MLSPDLTVTVVGEPGLGAPLLTEFFREALEARGVPCTQTRRRPNTFTIDAREFHKVLTENRSAAAKS